ncbi:MAG: alpha/beta hydrolase [Dehalococcoidia bacterium]|nr:alpha/beta hydrolase [Dehalococcoidia bacterium]
MNIRRGYADTSLGQIHYRVHGDPAMPAALLLHQSAQSGDQFEPVLPILGRRLWCVAPDTIGYGMSDRVDRVIEPEEYARSFVEAFDAAGGPARFAVVGVHTGASLGTQIALLYPDRVTHLVLSGPVLIHPSKRGLQLRKASVPPPPEPDGSHLARMWQNRWAVVAPVQDARLFQRRLLNVLIAGDYAQSAYHAVYKYDLLEQLARVRCPVTVIYGDRDIPAPGIEECRPLIPQIPVYAIAGAGLDTIDEAPDEWARQVIAAIAPG